MHRQIVYPSKFHGASIIICVHLETCLPCTVILRFALEITICYEQRSAPLLCSGNKIEENYHFLTNTDRDIRRFFCRWVFSDLSITRLLISRFTIWLLTTPLLEYLTEKTPRSLCHPWVLSLSIYLLSVLYHCRVPMYIYYYNGSLCNLYTVL